MIERKTYLLALLDENKEENENEYSDNLDKEDEDDDDRLIYFELDAINIAIAIGGARFYIRFLMKILKMTMMHHFL